MPLTEHIEYPAITVNEFGHVHVRRDRVILDGTQEVGRNPFRYVLAPGVSLEGQPANVVAIATAAWTPAVLAKYAELKAHLDAQQEG